MIGGGLAGKTNEKRVIKEKLGSFPCKNPINIKKNKDYW